MKLSKKSRYALEALVYMTLYSDGKPMKAGEVAAGMEISAGYLEQIFFRLRKTGFLKTVRGKSGGFLLAAPAEETTAGGVVRALEGTLVPVACAENLSACTSPVRDRCVTRWLWVRMSDEIGRILDGMTLRSLADSFLQEDGQ